MSLDVSTYLRKKEQTAGNNELGNKWAKLDDLYTRKLWHQLTVELHEFAKLPGINLVELYDNFIRDFEMRINPLSFTEIVLLICQQMQNSPEQQLAFLEKQEPKIKASKEAQALCRLARGGIKLTQNKFDETKELLEQVEEILNSLDGITTVHGRFYLLQSELLAKLKETSEYYRSALKFLGCTPPESLTKDEKTKIAFSLTEAAIVSEGVYNFGELLAHPILNSLKGTDQSWLINFLVAFNSGSIEDFYRLKPKWVKVKEFAENEAALETKIKLLAIMEMTFKRPATGRQLTFAEIAKETQLPEDKVEIYVMKAISKGLVKGLIDEVDQKVHMTWVQPRVLDRQQIGTLISRLDVWKKEIQSVESMVEKNASDILL